MSNELAKAAEQLRVASCQLTVVLADRDLRRSLLRSPRTGWRAWWGLWRALSRNPGLGFAIMGKRLRTVGLVGTLVGGESLAAHVAAASLRARITVLAERHPDLYAEPFIKELIEAVSDDRQLASARAIRKLVKQRGGAGALNALAPVLSEIAGLNALLDENPFNDEAGWSVTTGAPLRTDWLFGIGADVIARFDRGEGRVEPVAGPSAVDLSGTLMGSCLNLAALGPGELMIQEIEGPDGDTRFLVIAPGMRPGRLSQESPQDFVGAWCNNLKTESTYARCIRKALAASEVPPHAELALVGHSAGGAALMNLAQDTHFSELYKVTHLIVVGAPIDTKTPADRATWVATITNEHDFVPTLDGQLADGTRELHPGWYVVSFHDDALAFPPCHAIERYIYNLTAQIPAECAEIDARLAPYQNTVLRSLTYRMYDH
jgi:hypothetical protein